MERERRTMVRLYYFSSKNINAYLLLFRVVVVVAFPAFPSRDYDLCSMFRPPLLMNHHPVFSKAINQVLEQFNVYANPTDIEKKLRLVRLNWYAQFMRHDPLGLGVPLGYLALKLNEIRNLFWISRGILFKMQPQTIQNNLEFAG